VTTPPFDPPSAGDIETVSHQLGRPARNVIGIAARCVCGAPTVVATSPRLDDGTPFPTLYYLCHPAATAAISTLEATGVMPEFAARLGEDTALAGHALAAGPGVNPIGDLALERAAWSPLVCECEDYAAAGAPPGAAG
jgi:hypothetical protein